ncbi:MAG: hypothetical protein FLDDKLPJ_01933 [Phycisphaerae bacterium]|nr:hypothetical protein [Phycisphaerae bacterium]
MADIRRLVMWAHLRSEPNEYVLHYTRGRLLHSGTGLAYWFNPLSAAVALVPVDDIETTFVVKERTLDFQEVNVQCVLTYRCAEPKSVAERLNFGLSLRTGAWIESPLEKLSNLWAQRSRQPVRSYINTATVNDAVRCGAEVIRKGLFESLRTDEEIRAMGLTVVTVQVEQVVPSAELQKALETPTREAIQQKADEAVFQRRALAVEKERAIKENELATQIELVRRQEELIRRQGANQVLEVQSAAAAEKARVEAELERKALEAGGYAHESRVKAEGEAAAARLRGEAEADVQRRIVEVWKTLPGDVVFGLALREFARKLNRIEHLNVTPDLIGQAMQRLFLNSDGDADRVRIGQAQKK